MNSGLVRKDAVRLVKRLREHGHEAYLVGGCVRDLLLGLRPKDFDIATDARPEQVMSIFKRTIPVGKAFGVVLVRFRGKNYEVATFREEWGYEDGRHPRQVRFSSLEADARRRDFTINGMFYDPLGDRLIDLVRGREDLSRGLIRAIGDPDLRFREDKLRILRAVRFAARFGFKIEKKTAEAIKRRREELLEVSKERIRDELVFILTDERPAEGIRLMDEFGLLDLILPEVAAMKGVPQPPQFHPEGDVFTHTLLMLKLMKKKHKARPELPLAVLFHDIGKPVTFKVADRIRFNNHPAKGEEMTRRIMRRLRFSRETEEIVAELVREHLKFMEVRNMRPATLKRFLRGEHFELHLELHRLDCLASHGDLSNYRFCKRKLKEFAREQEELKPPRLLTGHDLIAFGLKPGPFFKEILKNLEDAQLEGKVRTREEALEWLREFLSSPGRPEGG